MAKNKNKKGLTVKDLITAGVFSALLLVSNALGGGLFAVNPALTFYYPIAGAVLGGPIFMLLLAKVPKRGALTIVGVVACILGFVTGMHWGMDLGCLIMLTVADILAGIGQYRNQGTEHSGVYVLLYRTGWFLFCIFCRPAGMDSNHVEERHDTGLHRYHECHSWTGDSGDYGTWYFYCCCCQWNSW